MKIFSAAFGTHDHNTYDGEWHNQRERYTRKKHNVPKNLDDSAGQQFYKEYWKPDQYDVFAYTTTLGFTGGVKQIPQLEPLREWMNWSPKTLWDYKRKDSLYYIDHHQSHAAYAYLLSEFEESDILAIDGYGFKYNCIFINKYGKIIDLSKQMAIGLLWNWFSKFLGFGMGMFGAGKVMGLAAYGEYSDEFHLRLNYYWKNHQKFKYLEEQRSSTWLNMMKPEDVAKTLQVATEEMIRDHVFNLKSCNNLCVSGGVAYNGYVNEMFTKEWDKVYVPPAPGDEGQAIGTYMHADYVLNNNLHRPHVYAGKEYAYHGKEKFDLREVAQAIADGKIVGWFQGKSESGHRALGNRSILADPRNPNIKNIINRTIKMREDFRPFAPSVLEKHYQEWFNTSQPSPYMSRIMPVKKPEQVPGITHVDGTARIQTVNPEQNLRYHQLITEFYDITGVPMILNTSFNCQEPIVETPEEAINTFEKTAMDVLVINDYILRKGSK